MIYIRADANLNIGMGHIMRCLSIADAASNLGHDITFILADDSVSSLVRDRGYKAVVLNSDYTSMEAELGLWPEITPDVIIVDSYYVTEDYLREEKNRCGMLVYIDDLATFPYPVDVLVNYNAYGLCLDYHGLYESSGVQEPRLIFGPSYAPLRSMFRGVEKKKQPETVTNVLISTGGSDTEHIALSIVKAKPKNYKYHILVGALNADKTEIEELADCQENIILHENVTDMKSLISSMDIAVSAAGSTLYEICSCGVPLITYTIADNQILGAEAFEKLGLAENLGDMRKNDDPAVAIIEAIDTLSHDFNKRVRVGEHMQEMIDGYGADRMIQEILRS